MKDCAYYYDKPTLLQEKKMKKDLQYKYDDLFEAGIFPRLQTRQTLLQWACKSWQASKQEWQPNEIEHDLKCENYP